MAVKRIEYLDSLKFILIVFVVFGHVMEHDIYPSQLRQSIYSFIYCFHMPLFVMISGYFSKSTLDFNKLLKYVLRFFLSYLIFQTILFLPEFINKKHFSLFYVIFAPYGPMWYLIGLICWRIFIFIIQKLKIPALIAIPISFLISFLIFNIEYMFMFRYIKIFSFLPIFLIGYYLKDKSIEILKKKRVLPSVLLLIIVFLCIYVFGNGELPSYLYFYVPFVNYEVNHKLFDILIQILMYPLTIFTSILVFNLCANLPSKLEKFFAQYGSKTYAIYLLHSVLVYDIYMRLINPSKVHSDIFDEYLFRDVFVTGLIIIICIFLDRFKVVKYIVDPYSFIEDIKSKKYKI